MITNFDYNFDRNSTYSKEIYFQPWLIKNGISDCLKTRIRFPEMNFICSLVFENTSNLRARLLFKNAFFDTKRMNLYIFIFLYSRSNINIIISFMLFRAPVYNNFSNLSRLPGLFGILLSTSTSKLVGCQVDQEISYFVSITEGHKKK